MPGLARPFLYFVSNDRDSLARRDTCANHHVCRSLWTRGYGPGEHIHNYPVVDDPNDEPPVDDAWTAFPSSDVILQTTRPPMDDDEHGDRKRVPNGIHPIEPLVFDAVRPYISTCARSALTLSRETAAQLPREWASLGTMKFAQYEHARLTMHRCHPGLVRTKNPWRSTPVESREMITFLLRVEHLWADGPGLVLAFGMNGKATYAWTHRLAHDLGHLLDRPRFLMAKLSFPLDLRVDSGPDWPANVPYEIVLDLPEDGAMKRARRRCVADMDW